MNMRFERVKKELEKVVKKKEEYLKEISLSTLILARGIVDELIGEEAEREIYERAKSGNYVETFKDYSMQLISVLEGLKGRSPYLTQNINFAISRIEEGIDALRRMEEEIKELKEVIAMLEKAGGKE